MCIFSVTVPLYIVYLSFFHCNLSSFLHCISLYNAHHFSFTSLHFPSSYITRHCLSRSPSLPFPSLPFHSIPFLPSLSFPPFLIPSHSSLPFLSFLSPSLKLSSFLPSFLPSFPSISYPFHPISSQFNLNLPITSRSSPSLPPFHTC